MSALEGCNTAATDPAVSRRNFLRTLASGVAAAAMPSLFTRSSHAQTPTRPNIVVIMSDDHSRYFTPEYLGRFNISTITNLLPNMQRLAQEGVRFDNAFSTNSLCAPARGTILTGKYAHMHGVTGNNIQAFRHDADTMPNKLKAAGYQTAIFGKWHLGLATYGGQDPQGFDQWKLRDDGRTYSSTWEDYTDVTIREKTNSSPHPLPGYFTTAITDDGINWIKARNKTQPFFLFLSHVAPHEAWMPEDKYKSLLSTVTLPQPPTFNDTYSERGQAIKDCDSELDERLLNVRWPIFVTNNGKTPVPSSLTTQQKKEWLYQQLTKDYLRCLKSLDDQIGRVLDCINSEGIANNTMVIYTSDNGAFLGEHGFYDKRLMYEESMRLPLYVKYPPLTRANSTNTSLVCDVDFAPTILDVAGITPPAAMQGKSFKSILQGTQPADWRKAIYYHYWDQYSVHYIARHEGIRNEYYKLIHYYKKSTVGDIDEWEFYDLRADEKEMHNKYTHPTYQSIIAKMKHEMLVMHVKYQVPEPAAPDSRTGQSWVLYG